MATPVTEEASFSKKGAHMPQSKNKIKSVATALLSVLAIVYVLYHITNAFRAGAELFLVEPVTEYHTIDVSGGIFRDETVIYGIGDGVCSYTYDNGEKVSSGSTVARTYFFNNDELEKKISELNFRIDVLSDSTGRKSLELVDKKIEQYREQIALYLAEGNTAFAQSIQKELLILLHERSLIEENADDYSDYIALLETERSLLLANLSASEKQLTADHSGYFYSYTDGYENTFTADAAQSLTIEGYKALLGSNSQKSSSAIGKIASSYKWYFVCLTTAEKCEQIVADKTYTVTFVDNTYNTPITLFLENKTLDRETGEAMLVFSSSTLPSNFDFSRFQRATITVEQIEGLRIPSSCVRVFDKQTSVYVISEGVCRIKKIDILFEKDGYCVVSENDENGYIRRYDRLILGDNDLYDGKVID